MEQGVVDKPRQKGKKAEWFPGRTVEERNRYVEENLGLVGMMVGRYKATAKRNGRPLGRNELDDLFQDGSEGLMHAAQRYDPSRGTEFSTCALFWIRRNMRRSFHSNHRCVHLPCDIAEDKQKYLEERRRLSCEIGSMPSPAEVVASLKMPPVKAARLAAFGRLVLTRWTPEHLLRDRHALEFGDRKPASKADAEAADRLACCVSLLKPMQAEVLTLRYGLDGKGERLLGQIGKQMGFSSERARQIEQKALGNLRSLMTERREAA